MGKTMKYNKNNSIVCKPQIISKCIRNTQSHQIQCNLLLANTNKLNNCFTRVNGCYKVYQQSNNINSTLSSYKQQVFNIMHVLSNEDVQSKLNKTSIAKDIQLSNNKIIQKQQTPKQTVKQHRGHDWPNIIFRFFITLLILGAGICVFDFYHFYKYIQISSKIKLNETVDQKELLNHLEFLTWVTMPYHQYFYEQKIYQLGKLKQWARVISQSEKALRYSHNSKKFSIYYHKAMAHCFIQQFKQCRDVTFQARKFATKENFYYLKDIYTILVSNGYLSQAQIPSGKQFISQPGRILQEKSKKQKDQDQVTLQSL